MAPVFPIEASAFTDSDSTLHVFSRVLSDSEMPNLHFLHCSAWHQPLSSGLYQSAATITVTAHLGTWSGLTRMLECGQGLVHQGRAEAVRTIRVLCTMSLQAWDWEGEEGSSMGPHSVASESEMEENLKSRIPAHDWDSEDQFSSSLHSSEGPACISNSDVPQIVPCRFEISLAFPVLIGNKGKTPNVPDKKKSAKTETRTGKARQFYHIEYFFLPDDIEPKIVDIVVFPNVAKVFLESGTKTVKPWRDDDKVWVSWSQTFHVNVTKELLKKLNFHKITLRLWDTKDRVSKRARYQRVKTSAYSEDLESLEEVKHLVLSHKKLSLISIGKTNTISEELKEENLPGDQEKAEKHLKSPQEPEAPSKNDEECEKLLKMEDSPLSRRTISKIPISLSGATMMEIKELIEKPSLSSLTNMLEKQKSQLKGKDTEVKKKNPKKVKRYQAEEEGDQKPEIPAAWKQSIFSIQLPIMPLLAGWRTVICRGSEKSANILDCFLTLKTEVPIMTEQQKQDLNPLTIKIRCVSCLPIQPISIHDLERLCSPVYCRYQFHKTPVHETKREPHGTHVFFQDINVIFLGAMNPSDVREYLEGPPMVVEVHDRDRKLEEYSRKPALFGEDLIDSYFNLQAFISHRDTETNPYESQNKIWDPYGVARVSFADLLFGYKYLNLIVPIHNCEPKSPNWSQDSRNRRTMGVQVPTDVLQHSSIPKGNYLEANSLLKLRVDIAVPLSGWSRAPELDLMGTHFGRIIFVFHAKKLSLLQSLLQDITMINAKALELDCYPLQNIQQILSAFKVRVKIQEQQELDVLTGFHLLDGKIHLFILEGLADRGLRQLWESYQSSVTASNRAACKVLYDSRLLFCHRLYADLETILYHVHLFRPVSVLLRYPALYVRGAVSRMAFKALSRIHDICHSSTRLKEVVMRDLLPSSSMIKELSQEFGIPISQEDLTDGKLLTALPQPDTSNEDIQRRTSTLPLEIQVHQEKYLQWRNDMLLKNQVHRDSIVQKNITEAYQFTKKSQKPMRKVIRIAIPENKTVHNYSAQTMNSTELAKKQMLKEMAKEPRKRFTYSQNYLSAMVDFQDPKEEEKKAQKKSRQAWLTAGVAGKRTVY
uniref:Cilia and flagella associated protein 92 n=1 Tax=Mus spicilegus TaxID=10103 RepID=A0A8C6H417_MUSSI